ncbi:MAG: RNA-guided pseudouridylation complex pseudouridine synthase subunit Cbf5 [Methanobacteriota archaeon]|nr:MAG: RNA-guided pseudouridylation complex pseudouridine synthase subunit Cbf5 [Euryarchaeota archaeon]
MIDMDGCMVLDEVASSSPEHGCAPIDRDIAGRLAAGWLLVDKPAGPTSHQVSAWARDLLGLNKLGHGGTLDPFATGVLALMSGRTMRLTDRVLKIGKTYVAVLRLSADVEDASLAAAVTELKGEILNVPPKQSAVKIRVRTRTLHAVDVHEREGRYVVISISCAAGTYIRTWARDLGLLLGTRVELIELRRTRSGHFSEESTVNMQQLADAVWLWQENDDPTALERVVRPVEELLVGIPRVFVKDGAAAAVCHGAPLLRPGVVAIDRGLANGDEVRLLTLKGEAVALARMQVDGARLEEMKTGEVAKSTTVLMEVDTYPRGW